MLPVAGGDSPSTTQMPVLTPLIYFIIQTYHPFLLFLDTRCLTQSVQSPACCVVTRRCNSRPENGLSLTDCCLPLVSRLTRCSGIQSLKPRKHARRRGGQGLWE